MPSSTKCLARSRTDSGTSSSDVSATHVASRPVGPFGSVARRGSCPFFSVVLSVAVAAMAFLAFSSIDELVDVTCACHDAASASRARSGDRRWVPGPAGRTLGRR